MLKRVLFIILLALTAPAAHADAAAVQDRIVRELQSDGYREIRMSRTLLGRLRFVAVRPGSRREIVVSPATGLILRDYIYFFADNDGSNSGGSGDHDEHDDDDGDDDDDDKDNSGPGSSNSGSDDHEDDESDNSGSGSSNSGSGSDDDD